MAETTKRTLTEDEQLTIAFDAGLGGLISFALACIAGSLTVGSFSTIPMAIGSAILGTMFGFWLGLRSVRKAIRKKAETAAKLAAERAVADHEGRC